MKWDNRRLLYWNLKAQIFDLNEGRIKCFAIENEAARLVKKIDSCGDDPKRQKKALQAARLFLAGLGDEICSFTPRFPTAPVGWVVNINDPQQIPRPGYSEKSRSRSEYTIPYPNQEDWRAFCERIAGDEPKKGGGK